MSLTTARRLAAATVLAAALTGLSACGEDDGSGVRELGGECATSGSASGSEASGSEASGSEASGSEASGSEASGSEASGSEASGSASEECETTSSGGSPSE